MALDGWRVVSWDLGDFDRRLARVPPPERPGPAVAGPEALSLREVSARLALPARCLLTGAMLALLYGWPALMIGRILGGFSSRAFGEILLALAALGTLACWLVAAFEQRYWARHRDRLSEFADPPPWK